MNELIIMCNIILRAWFIRHRHYLEQTKTFVFSFVFVFVLAHEQAISSDYKAHSSESIRFGVKKSQEEHIVLKENRVIRCTLFQLSKAILNGVS